MNWRLSIILFAALCTLNSNSWAIGFAEDPSRLSIGARVLGMGGAFVGLADDSSAMFINPAGLGQIGEPQFSSMSGKFVNLFNYAQVSAVLPLPFGTLGVGYGGSSIDFRFPSAEVIIIGDQTRIVPTGEVSGRYANNALLIALGRKMNLLWLKDVSLGAAVKILSQDLALSELGGGTASGAEMNFGLLYPLNKKLNFGVSILNALPESVGKIKWTTAKEEALPAILRAGLAYRGAAAVEPNLLLDYENNLDHPDFPPLWRAGAEWRPNPLFVLRAGLEQNYASGNGLAVSNDLTYGLGLIYSGFRFDYAYHIYNYMAENATSYFSFTYVPEKAPPPPEKQYFSISSPAARAEVHEDRLTVSGRILEREVKTLLIDGGRAAVDKKSNFRAEVGLKTGRNIISAEARDKSGKLLSKVDLKVSRLASFSDVGGDYRARLPIERLATLGIVAGYPDGSFQPEATVTRAELTTLLMKIRGTKDEAAPAGGQGRGTTEGGTAFNDVQASHWAAPFIAAAAKTEIVTGYPDGTFRPAKLISRAEGLAVITRFAGLGRKPISAAPYKDVPGRHWGAPAVSAARDAGWLDFIKEDLFQPDLGLKRGEMCYILSKTEEIAKLAEEKL